MVFVENSMIMILLVSFLLYQFVNIIKIKTFNGIITYNLNMQWIQPNPSFNSVLFDKLVNLLYIL